MAAEKVRGKIQQPPCFVIDQQQHASRIDDDDAFPRGVQDRFVVLVQARDLGRAEAMGLPQQPSADECCPRGGDSQGAGRDSQYRRQLPRDLVADILLEPAHVHRADDGTVGVLDGYGGADHLAPGPVEPPLDRLAVE